MPERGGDVREVRAEAGVGAAPEIAKTLAVAAGRVARDGEVAPPQRVAAALDEPGDGPDDVSRRGPTFEETLDARSK